MLTLDGGGREDSSVSIMPSEIIGLHLILFLLVIYIQFMFDFINMQQFSDDSSKELCISKTTERTLWETGERD